MGKIKVITKEFEEGFPTKEYYEQKIDEIMLSHNSGSTTVIITPEKEKNDSLPGVIQRYCKELMPYTQTSSLSGLFIMTISPNRLNQS